VAPTTAAVAWRHRRHPRRVIGAFALGAVPAVAWTCASMWYYGFPFPNTAYAKLGSGLSTADRLTQGLAYFGDSFHRDRLTIPAVGAGVLLGLRTAGLDRTLALGIVAYLSYVAWIGGDFMSGRFLSVPVVAGVILLIRAPLGRVELRIGAAVAAVLASMTLHATLLSGPEYHDKTISAGVADERGFYFQNSGLIARGWTALRLGSADNRLDWVESPRRVLVTCGRLGAAGMTAGPSVHIIDPCGLADPLLARLPPRQDLELRAGHYARLLPTGYMQSVQSRSNEIADPDVRDFYEVLRHITRGPLMDVSRITEVLRVNFGRSDPANRVNARFWSPPKALPISTVSTVVDGGTWNAPGHVVFDRAVIFTLPSQATVHEVDVSLDGNDTYRIEGMVHGRAVEIVAFGPVKVPPPGGGIVRHVHVLPLPLDNVAAIRVTALNGDERYSVAHLIVH
jgi:arabinofuranosyltransferase